MSDSWEKRLTEGKMNRQTDGLMNMNSQDLPTNAGVQKIFKKNTKIIDKSRKKMNYLNIKSGLPSFNSWL